METASFQIVIETPGRVGWVIKIQNCLKSCVIFTALQIEKNEMIVLAQN